MGTRKVNPCRVKQHRSYTVEELARCLDVHKNTVRGWQRAGLAPIDSTRPLLFLGPDVRSFLTRRNASRKSPCPPGTLYCFRCRAPRSPALAMADYTATTAASGMLKALCDQCGTVMHRRTRKGDLPRILPGIRVQITQG